MAMDLEDEAPRRRRLGGVERAAEAAAVAVGATAADTYHVLDGQGYPPRRPGDAGAALATHYHDFKALLG